MLKNTPCYLEWEKLVKNEYSVKVFNAAKKKAIKKFSKYNVAPDNAIHWVPDFEQTILREMYEIHKVDQYISDMIKKENEIYHSLQTIMKEDEIDAIYQTAFEKWLELYGEFCEDEPDYNNIDHYIYNAFDTGCDRWEISDMCDCWIACIRETA